MKIIVSCNRRPSRSSKQQMASNTDQIYIDKVLNGDSSAYKMLVDKHKDMAFSIALKIVRIREDAEELTQDAFIKAYQKLSSFRRDSKFSTWLYRIVYNAAISHTRKRRLESTELTPGTIENYSVDEISESMGRMDAEQQKKLVNELIEQLPALEFTLINLYYRKELSIDEISSITDLSASNVKVKLYRIRKEMYRDLQKEANKEFNKIYS
ncbi:MAG: sigma-70 family RNA polymerase sigma factor [Chlorobi bacterium]|nr:sigma-70 family RNA polymerase sigma factor [Chlorobiota bacterium]